VGELLGDHSPKRQAEHVGSLDGEVIEQVAHQRRKVTHRPYRRSSQDSPVSGRADANSIKPVEMPLQR
jgi:hypothetical protein